MKWLVAFLLLSPLAVAQTGLIAGAYVIVSVDKDDSYRFDEEVVIPFQAWKGEDGRRLNDLVKITLRTNTGALLDYPGGQQDFNQGILPETTYLLNFGKLPVGLYNVRIVAQAGSIVKEALLEFEVLYPPTPYTATLSAGSGEDGIFRLRGEETFHVEVYTDSGGPRRLIESATGSNITIDVPYVVGEKTKVEVTGPHGWKNYENKIRFNGRSVYSPWIWDPEAELSEQAQLRDWENLGIGAVVILVAIALFAVALRRRA